ncbi:hypothetical protein BDY17DRAFT_120461 [Neohortaea acidophila]|uniref:Uncharacterized protein n=1 Tax=Neohortaea acidophila TaxID=245834 RepID=A0A6A6PX44_9PEZI|nr:uncharacterized protein BDY17DRAFT_120461 [Neohortaea acidophila]KAF2484053.1 hypothetical protein BDY17DRAFT_120461 [Neohortaea acidophila]
MRTAADDATVSASDCNAQNLPWPNGGHQRFTCVWLSALLRPLTCPQARLAGRDLRGLTSSISAWRLSSTLESLRIGWRRAICPFDCAVAAAIEQGRGAARRDSPLGVVVRSAGGMLGDADILLLTPVRVGVSSRLSPPPLLLLLLLQHADGNAGEAVFLVSFCSFPIR